MVCSRSSAVNRSRHTASFDSMSEAQQPRERATRPVTEGMITADARKESSFSKQRGLTASSDSAQATRCATLEKPQSTLMLEPKESEVAEPAVKPYENSSFPKSAPSTSVTKCWQGQSRIRELTGFAEVVTKPVRVDDQCYELGAPLAMQLSSRSGSKRAGCGALSHARCADSTEIFESCTVTKYGLWSEAGRLRSLEVRCYCDACMGLKSSTCSSPRMAELKKLNGRSDYRGPRATKTV